MLRETERSANITADLQVDAGRCWLDLGRPALATRALDEGLTLLDPARSRTRAVFQVVQADSALRDHDLERAVSHAHTALETALVTGASRCTDLVRTLIPRLAAHANGAPHVAAFLDTAEQRLQTA
ncbi:hypothetical protein [Streptomyces chryseus]|uniref:hypothetical protein n=1 Tax=Streptomyces chryseus TaxID=68186 RepID=UPI00110FD24B|nr:hypothetical protein [Streptomyces chryseus]